MLPVLYGFAFLFPLQVYAITRIPLRRYEVSKRSQGTPARRSGVKNTVVVDDGDEDVVFKNVNDLVYLADVSIGGTNYTVQLDTGSSDLWVKPTNGQNLPGVTTTELTQNITYGIGYAFGHISTAPVSFAGYSVQSQAILYVSDGNNPIFEYGAVGIFGLGFTSLSRVDKTVSAAGGNWGHAFLHNVFAQDITKPNYVAFLLERTSDRSQQHQGSFSIGELEADYASAISDTPQIPTWPESNPTRWNVLLDGYEFGDGIVRTLPTNVDDAPSAVLMLDTGASYTYAPEALVSGLYGKVPGASFNSKLGLWNVPCNQQVNLAFWIAGRKFDWHPLDLVVPLIGDNATCVGSVVPSQSSKSYDMHAGDVFLRGLYTILDFGDFDSSGKPGDPYVQLLSLVDIQAANKEYQDIRGASPPDYKSSNGLVNADGTVTQSTIVARAQLSENVDKVLNFMPIALGILGLNALLLVVVLIIGIILLRRRGPRKSRNSAQPSAIIPLSRTHSYQPVNDDNPDPDTPASIRKYTDDMGSAYDGESTAVGDDFKTGGRRIRQSKALPLTPPHLRVSCYSTAGTTQRVVSQISSRPSSPFNPIPPGEVGLNPSNLSNASLPHSQAGESGDGPTSPGAVSVHSTHSSTNLPASTSPTSNLPIPRGQAYLQALDARKAATGDDARRNTYHDVHDGAFGDGGLTAPRRHFATQDSSDPRRTTFHETGDGLGAERSTIYFDAPEAPAAQQRSNDRPGSQVLQATGHNRTASAARSAPRGMSGPSPLGASPIHPTRQGSAPVPGSYNGLGHGRSPSNMMSGHSLSNLSNVVGSGAPAPMRSSSTGWKVAEETDLTEQRPHMDTLVGLDPPPSWVPQPNSMSPAHS